MTKLEQLEDWIRQAPPFLVKDISIIWNIDIQTHKELQEEIKERTKFTLTEPLSSNTIRTDKINIHLKHKA